MRSAKSPLSYVFRASSRTTYRYTTCVCETPSVTQTTMHSVDWLDNTNEVQLFQPSLCAYIYCIYLRHVSIATEHLLGECSDTPITNMKFLNFTIVWPCIVIDSLWIKTTDALNSNFIGITNLHVSGRPSTHHQEFLAVHRLWYILCSCDDRFLPGVGWNCIADVRLRTPDDGQKGCPKHVES